MTGLRRPPFDPRLIAITPGISGDLERLVTAAAAGGATVVQLRDKAAPDGPFLAAARRLRAALPAGVAFTINDRVDVALLAAADGVHVGQDDLPAAGVRLLLGPGPWVGVSAETPEEARAAEAAGADYLGVGPVFATSSKPDAGDPQGPALIERIRAATRLPIVAIGGITPENAAEAIRAGADGVAAIGAIFGSPDPEAAAARLRDAVERALAARGR